MKIIILNYTTMSWSQQQTYLPIKLAQIIFKLQSIFFKKMILNKQDLQETAQIRHYDYECQGLLMLKGFIDKKRQSLLIKSFYQIQQVKANNNKVKNIQTLQFKQECQPKYFPSVTRRTYIVSNNSIPSRRSPVKMLEPAHSAYNQSSSRLRKEETESSLQNLLSKVKKINQNNRSLYNQETNRDYTDRIRQMGSTGNGSYYGNYRDDQYAYRNRNQISQNHEREYDSRKRISTQYNPYETFEKDQSQRLKHNKTSYFKNTLLSVRNSRRQFIMDKFNQIENDLESLEASPRKQPKSPHLRVSENIRADLMLFKRQMKRNTLDQY